MLYKYWHWFNYIYFFFDDIKKKTENLRLYDIDCILLLNLTYNYDGRLFKKETTFFRFNSILILIPRSNSKQMFF